MSSSTQPRCCRDDTDALRFTRFDAAVATVAWAGLACIDIRSEDLCGRVADADCRLLVATSAGDTREVTTADEAEYFDSAFVYALAYDQRAQRGIEGLPDEWRKWKDGSWLAAPSATRALAAIRGQAGRCASTKLGFATTALVEAVPYGSGVVLFGKSGVDGAGPGQLSRWTMVSEVVTASATTEFQLGFRVGHEILAGATPVGFRRSNVAVGLVFDGQDYEITVTGTVAATATRFRRPLSFAGSSALGAVVVVGTSTLALSGATGWSPMPVPRAAASPRLAVRNRDDRALLAGPGSQFQLLTAGLADGLAASLPELADATITAGADLAGIGLVLAAETTLDGVPSTVLVRRWLTDDDQVTNEADRWRWYVALKGQTGVTTLAAANGVLYWGGAQAWGRFSRADGLCVADGQLAPIRRILDLDDGSVFILGSGAYEWLAAPTNP